MDQACSQLNFDSLIDYLNEYQLEILQTKPDGHCLIHASMLALRIEEKQYQMLICSIKKEFQNQESWLAFTTCENRQQFEIEINDYLENRIYQSCAIDVVPNIISKIYKTKIYILKPKDNIIYCFLQTFRREYEDSILLLLQDEHYQAIIPRSQLQSSQLFSLKKQSQLINKACEKLSQPLVKQNNRSQACLTSETIISGTQYSQSQSTLKKNTQLIKKACEKLIQPPVKQNSCSQAIIIADTQYSQSQSSQSSQLIEQLNRQPIIDSKYIPNYLELQVKIKTCAEDVMIFNDSVSLLNKNIAFLNYQYQKIKINHQKLYLESIMKFDMPLAGFEMYGIDLNADDFSNLPNKANLFKLHQQATPIYTDLPNETINDTQIRKRKYDSLETQEKNLNTPKKTQYEPSELTEEENFDKLMVIAEANESAKARRKLEKKFC